MRNFFRRRPKKGGMPTSISLPPDLLDRIDRAARQRSMNRSQFIAMAVSRAVEQEENWPRFFFELMAESAMSDAAEE